MKWSNLRKNICPKCDKDIMKGVEYHIAREPLTSVDQLPLIPELVTNKIKTERMLVHPCGFSIRESRYAHIVNSETLEHLQDYEQKEEETI